MNKSRFNILNFIFSIMKNAKAKIGIYIFLFFITSSLLAPLFIGSPTDYVGTPFQSPSIEFWFGTNGQGQDVFAQTIHGARKTLFIAVLSAFLVVFTGAIIGGVAGYFGGRSDDFLSLLINIFLLLPGLPLMVILAAWLPPGSLTIIIVLVFTGWAWHARVLRSQVMAFRKQDFVSASRVCGESNFRIITIEILPRMLSLMTSSFIGATIHGIGAQVGLEFLGLGDISQVTWGTNLYWATNDLALLTGSWWTFVPTGVSIALVSLSLTLINFGIDELSNPRLISERHLRERIGNSYDRNSATPVRVEE
tara:strand:- start:255 stop:1178 length:924 start_codon:yes stop_codon:yes gene_type:complete